eukprot:TRINITY_DN89_c0_g1_i2.p1 TRINITY_DN89_c0_g1~~TRINITY_DN89_c0_g1_i2.p1  ORF type:complete len:1140 (+),score=323.12 TRINITY_DN89_c0_g1_i2:100-3420(+)
MACRGRRVGLPTVLVLLTLLLVLCASVITAVLLSAAADTALSNGERTAENGLDTCFETGRSAAEEIAFDVLAGALEHAETSILKYLQPARTVVEQLRRYLLITPWRLINTAEFRNNTIRAAIYTSWLTAYSSDRSVRGINYINLHVLPGHAQMLSFFEDPRTEERGPTEYHHMMTGHSDSLPFDAWYLGTPDNASGHSIPGPCDEDAPVRTNGTQPMGVCPGTVGTAEAGSAVVEFMLRRTGMSWTPVIVIPKPAGYGHDSVVLQLLTSFTHPQMPPVPVFGAKSTVLWTQLEVRRVSDYLRDIAGRITGGRARLYVVQTDPFTNRSGLMLGTSHGGLLLSGSGGATGHAQLLNARDLVVRTHARKAMHFHAPAEHDGATYKAKHNFSVCSNPDEDRLELSPTKTVEQCAQQVLETTLCSLEFMVQQTRYSGRSLRPVMECHCIANGRNCSADNAAEGIYRRSTAAPVGYELEHDDEFCDPESGVKRLYSADAAEVTPEGCAMRARADAECGDIFYFALEIRFLSCYCLLRGKTCQRSGTYAEANAQPPTVFAWEGFQRPSAPESTAAATYGKLEGRLEVLRAADQDGGDEESWWARVVRVEDDVGLMLHISGLVPVEDMLAGALQSFGVAKAQIGVESEENRSDKDRAFLITYIVVAGVALVLLAAAAALPHLVVAPLSGLEADMALVAQMKTDQVRQRELSALTEVRRMQESFRAMLACIDLYKTYLPQSALQAADGGDEDDAELSAASSWTCSGHVHRAPDSSGSDAVALGDSGASRPASRRPSHFTEGADSGLSDSNKGRPVPSAQGELAACIIQRPKQKTLTLLLTNRLGFLKDAVRSAENAVVSMVQSVEAFAVHVQSQKGVVDLCIADHLSATFGAARLCAQHRAAAARSAQLFASAAPRRPAPADVVSLPGQCPDALPVPPQVTSAACAGAALCGDFGSSAGGRRYMIIGGLSSFALALERIGAASRIPLLVDSKVHADIATTWNLRARFLVSYPKRGSPNPVTLWEGLKEAVTDANNEWMYNLEKAEQDPSGQAWAQMWSVFTDAEATKCDPRAALPELQAYIDAHPDDYVAKQLENVWQERGASAKRNWQAILKAA